MVHKRKTKLRKEDFKIRKGEIIGFQGSWMSGLGTLIVKNLDTGRVENISCENAPTVRAFENAFGDIIQAGHTADFSKIKGKRIFYSVGDFGIFEGFTPVEQASSELVEAYKKQK